MSNPMKDDNDIDVLEKELGIQSTETTKHKCRFCNYESPKTSNVKRHMLSCKTKIQYKEKLHEMIETKKNFNIQITDNRQTNNNTVTNRTTNTTNNLDITIYTITQEQWDYMRNKIRELLNKEGNLKENIEDYIRKHNDPNRKNIFD
tara:strand:+ start:29589 stop:30029 length:441 start_codon:yes stop_codon:yes gene_type:complete